MDSTPAQCAALDYAPPPRWVRRRRVRQVAGAVLLLMLAAAAWRWGPTAWRQSQILYWQRQCLRYAAPADQVVYDQNPAAASALAAAGGEYVTLPVNDMLGRPSPVIAAAHVPRSAARLLALTPGNVAGTGPVLFLHERSTPSGARYLVIIRGAFSSDTLPQFISGHDVYGVILEPAGWQKPPVNRSGPIALSVLMGHAPPPRLRVFAGQPDPADATHFTIRYELNGKAGTVDGWLRDFGRGYAGLELKQNR